MLEKQNLLGLPQDKLKKFFSDLSEKPFRTKQIMQWIYHQGATCFSDMHNLLGTKRFLTKVIKKL